MVFGCIWINIVCLKPPKNNKPNVYLVSIKKASAVVLAKSISSSPFILVNSVESEFYVGFGCSTRNSDPETMAINKAIQRCVHPGGNATEGLRKSCTPQGFYPL